MATWAALGLWSSESCSWGGRVPPSGQLDANWSGHDESGVVRRTRRLRVGVSGQTDGVGPGATTVRLLVVERRHRN